MTETGPEPTAAGLSDTAAKRLIDVRQSLERSFTLFEEADRALKRGEDEILELQAQAGKVRQSEPDDLRRHLLDAKAYANDAQKRIGEATGTFTELDTELDQATTSIEAADRALDQLEQLPGGRTEQTRRLRHKLEEFREAVHQAGEKLQESRTELETAGTNLGPLLEVPEVDADQEQTANQEQTADRISSIGSGLDGQLADLRRGLRGPREELDTAASGAGPVADEGAELATALHAAANPTPEDQLIEPGSSERSALSRRLAGLEADRDHERDS